MNYDIIVKNHQKGDSKHMNYAQRIKDLREDKDLKQCEIAVLLGTSQSYYSQYELGKRQLPLEHLITLCKFYNVSADYIIGFTNIKKELPKK